MLFWVLPASLFSPSSDSLIVWVALQEVCDETLLRVGENFIGIGNARVEFTGNGNGSHTIDTVDMRE